MAFKTCRFKNYSQIETCFKCGGIFNRTCFFFPLSIQFSITTFYFYNQPWVYFYLSIYACRITNILNVTYKWRSHFSHHIDSTAGGNHSNFKLTKAIIFQILPRNFNKERLVTAAKALQRLQIIGPLLIYFSLLGWSFPFY